MTIYQRLLQYYLNSEKYFENYLIWFSQVFEHCGECTVGRENFDQYCNSVITIPKYHFESKIFTSYKAKEMKDNGYVLTLSDTAIKRYFTANYYDEQQFAVIFAHWYGLTEKQIRQIADKRKKKHAWDLLHYFICNSDNEAPDVPLKELDFRICNKGKYSIYLDNDTVISALYNKGVLLEEGTHKQFWIL